MHSRDPQAHLGAAYRVPGRPLPDAASRQNPNFAGAETAARRLIDLPEWQAARRVKCNPDAPQRAVRLAALRQGKTVVMAVPRLRAERCFLRLDPRDLWPQLSQAWPTHGAS